MKNNTPGQIINVCDIDEGIKLGDNLPGGLFF